MAKQFKSNFHKGQSVTYRIEGQIVEAVVLVAHRDGTVTVKALHVRPFKPGGHLGYRYRLPQRVLTAAE
jgi:hypothetical protein